MVARPVHIVGFITFIAVACMAVGKSDSSSFALTGTRASWCAPENLSKLANWESGSAKMQVSYCVSESSDVQGITVYSRLDVRQEDITTGRVIWKIHDEVKPGLRQVRLFQPGFTTLDTDGDGNRETFIGYYFPGDGLDPVEFKFLAHKDGKKFAIRGQLPRLKEEAGLYKAVHDPAFKSATHQFRAVTDSLFTAFITELCTDPELNLGLTVPARILQP